MRVIALIDGEHHPAVTRDALDRLAAKHDLRGVLFVGGEEKVGELALADPISTWGRDVTVASAAPAQGLRDLNSRTTAVLPVRLPVPITSIMGRSKARRSRSGGDSRIPADS